MNWFQKNLKLSPKTDCSNRTEKETKEEISYTTIKLLGYKAVKSDYSAFYGNHQKYEIGKEYTVEGDLIPCRNGIHFCRTLKDTLELFSPNQGTRYLKIEAEIPIRIRSWTDPKGIQNTEETTLNCALISYYKALDEYQKNKEWENPLLPFNMDKTKPELYQFEIVNGEKKFVSKKIKILEEVPFAEYAEQAYSPLIKNEEDYFKTFNSVGYIGLLQQKLSNYCGNTFSEGFIHYWTMTSLKNHNFTSKEKSMYEDCYLHCCRKFDAVKNENISSDLKIAILLLDN